MNETDAMTTVAPTAMPIMLKADGLKTWKSTADAPKTADSHKVGSEPA